MLLEDALLYATLLALGAVGAQAMNVWGNADCWGSGFQGDRGLRRHYVWCCLSFVKQHLGHPDCWGYEEAETRFSYASCCLVPEEPAGETPLGEGHAGAAPGTPELVAGPEAGSASTGARTLGLVAALAGRLHLDFQNPRLAALQSLRGCASPAWDEVLFAVKVKGGCLPCSTPPGDLERYINLPDDGCAAGRMLLALTVFVASAEEQLGQPPPHACQARAEATRLLEAMEEEVSRVLWKEQSGAESASALFFDLFGISPQQVRYMLQHTSLRDNYAPLHTYRPVPSSSGSGDDVDAAPLMFDLGMSGGMDSLFYLMHGFRVVAVEANPMMVLDVQTALRRFGKRLRILTAAIVSDEELKDLTDPAHLTGAEVDFHIHRNRPDFSALDGARVPMDVRAGTVPVRAVTCAELVAIHGRPYGVKIDAEGADRACLASLRRANASPPYLSTELPNVLKEGSDPAIELVMLLGSMGYAEFKLCRQSLYNSRTLLAISQETNLSELMVSRQGLGLGASGLFGEAAVDYVAGPRWRPASMILAELGPGGPVWVAGTMQEWFDLHARHE